MITKKHLEQMLRLNGLSLEASEDEIRTVLIEARWHADDVSHALTILKQEIPDTADEDAQFSTHRTLVTGAKLQPETINALLGVSLDVSAHTKKAKQEAQRIARRRQVISLVCVTTILTAVTMLGTMWAMDIDLFF